MEIFDDLEVEQDRIEAVLAGLDAAAWTSPSGAPGWSVADVVLHLAQSEEAVVASVGGISLLDSLPATVAGATSIDDVMARWVAAEREAPAAIFDRWRKARRAAVAALRGAEPESRLPWAAAPLKPTALATTRLAEHWAHALDVVDPLGIDFPDTDRLRHIAWLAHRSLPYGFSVAGEEPHDVFCDLTGPDGTQWTYGDATAESQITGSAGAFCRVGAQRLSPEASGLVTSGPHADVALRVLRNYAA
ncbi:MAG: maleylpyruvate isomerase family mycothiol-dependent enzyme [Frankiaceae bacterium]|nr:maleylpyruvate isomerase family mycothiol-dependent enzyme [Frankiaceae bacterium]